jgi:cysteine-rich repeat protein
MTFAFSLPNRAFGRLASSGLAVGLCLLLAACNSQVGVIGGGVGGNSVVGAGDSSANQGAGGNIGVTITLPDSSTVADAAQACLQTDAGSCCGNGILDKGEECDDGNIVGGDGCSPQCIVESDFVCPVAGQPCVSTVRCGDGRISGTEQCDDGNTVSGDGCSSSTCQLEPGWTCPVVDAACVAAACGDGIVAGTEQCDDGNTVSGDGCSRPVSSNQDMPVVPTSGIRQRRQPSVIQQSVATGTGKGLSSAMTATPFRSMAARRLARTSRSAGTRTTISPSPTSVFRSAATVSRCPTRHATTATTKTATAARRLA